MGNIIHFFPNYRVIYLLLLDKITYLCLTSTHESSNNRTFLAQFFLCALVDTTSVHSSIYSYIVLNSIGFIFKYFEISIVLARATIYKEVTSSLLDSFCLFSNVLFNINNPYHASGPHIAPGGYTRYHFLSDFKQTLPQLIILLCD